MKNLISVFCALCGVSLSLPFTAFADEVSVTTNVVAWWSMNGDVSTTLESVPSRGDAEGVLTAYPVKTKYGSVNSAATRIPVWTNAVGRTMGVLDPLTGTIHPETNAVRFIAPTLSGDAGLLRVTNPQALHLSTFTFETFVRRDLTRIGGDWNVIAVMPGALKTSEGKTLKNCDSWGLRFTGKTAVTLRLTKEAYTVASGEQVVGSGQNKEYGATVAGADDGYWHHLAFSIDSDTQVVKLFWDYKMVQRWALANPIWYGAEDLYLGATVQTAGPFHGCLAQVRITDKALEADSFLRFVKAEKGAGEGDDVLFHYDFEPEDGFPAMTFFNLAETGTPAAAVTQVLLDGVKYPLLDADVPGASVRPSYNSPSASTNNWSLANTYTNEEKRATGACLAHDMRGEDPFTNTSFTVECFYKSNGAIPQYTPFVRRRGGKNVQFNLGVSASIGTLTASYQKSPASNDGGSVTDLSRTDDGQWHHAALVVDYENNMFRLYRDYSLRGSCSLDNYSLTPSTYPICISGVVGEGNTFKGNLDDVRITMRALGPTEFLTTLPVSVSQDLAYIPFETNGLLSVTNPFLMQNAALATYAGGQKPFFSNDVPGIRIREGEEGAVHVNAASLAFQTGKVTYVSNPMFTMQPSQTIEFFVKLDAPPQQWASFVRCNKTPTQTVPTWAVGFTDNSGQINLRFDMVGGASINNGTGKYIADRRWHHVALAFEPASTGGTTAWMWLDYGEPYTKTVTGTMDWQDPTIVLGQIAASPSFIGKIDELRISSGVLDPSEFLRVEQTGTILIFR